MEVFSSALEFEFSGCGAGKVEPRAERERRERERRRVLGCIVAVSRRGGEDGEKRK